MKAVAGILNHCRIIVRYGSVCWGELRERGADSWRVHGSHPVQTHPEELFDQRRSNAPLDYGFSSQAACNARFSTSASGGSNPRTGPPRGREHPHGRAATCHSQPLCRPSASGIQCAALLFVEPCAESGTLLARMLDSASFANSKRNSSALAPRDDTQVGARPRNAIRKIHRPAG